MQAWIRSQKTLSVGAACLILGWAMHITTSVPQDHQPRLVPINGNLPSTPQPEIIAFPVSILRPIEHC